MNNSMYDYICSRGMRKEAGFTDWLLSKTTFGGAVKNRADIEKRLQADRA